MAAALFELMLGAGSPLLEDVAADPEAFVALHARERPVIRYGVAQLAGGLVGIGVLERSPLRARAPPPALPHRRRQRRAARPEPRGFPVRATIAYRHDRDQLARDIARLRHQRGLDPHPQIPEVGRHRTPGPGPDPGR
jgi:hypothetical protein